MLTMPTWELKEWADEAPRLEASAALQSLNLLTFSDWVGEMPDPEPTDDWREQQRQRAYAEGDEMRRQFRENLLEIARGKQPTGTAPEALPAHAVASDDDFYDAAGYANPALWKHNQHGEMVSKRGGAIVAKSEEHFWQILKRLARGQG